MKRFLQTLVLFTAALALLYLPIHPIDYFSSRPHGDHTWAQCDRASLALNYFQFHYSLLAPNTHNLAYNPTGIAAGEFPLIPFLVSKMYLCFGFHEYLFRIFTLAFSLVGFVVAFMIAKRQLKFLRSQLIASFVWLLSPNLIFYSTGFLPDTVALTFFILAFYFLLQQENRSSKNLFAFSVLSSVAVLLKSSVLFLVAAVFVSLLITAYKKKQLKIVLVQVLWLLLPFFSCILWILFARHSQQVYHSNIFKLSATYPLSFAMAISYCYTMLHNLPKVYPLPILILILCSLILLLRNFKAGEFFHVFALTAFFMWLTFFSLMMRNACYHGYYHIPFQFSVFAIFVAALKIAEEKRWQIKAAPVYAGLTSLFAFILYTNTLGKISSATDFVNKDWYTLESTLRTAGIKNSDRVFSANDASYNISLYCMNQRGWNCPSKVWDSYKIEALKNCDYAVLTDTSYLHQSAIEKYFGKEITQYGSLHIYRVTPSSIPLQN